MTRNVTECQRELIRLGFLESTQPDGTRSDDGRAGQLTFAAFNRFLANKGRPPVDPSDFTLTAINAALWPEQLVPPVSKPPTFFNQIGAVVSIINLLKGKTMTNDQIAGLVRTILASLLAYVAGKGWIPNASPELIASLTTVVVAVWSWVSNRPKTITKIGQ